MTTFATSTVPFCTNPSMNMNNGVCATPAFVPVFNGYGWQYIPCGNQGLPVNYTNSHFSNFPTNTNTWHNWNSPVNTYPYGFNQPAPWMNSWNSQAGYVGAQNWCNTTPCSPIGCPTPCGPTNSYAGWNAFPSFNQCAPWNSFPAQYGYNQNAWYNASPANQHPFANTIPTGQVPSIENTCHPFTQGCPTGVPCNTGSCWTPSSYSQYTPWNVGSSFPGMYSTPNHFGFHPFNMGFNPIWNTWNGGAANHFMPNTNSWYGNSAFPSAFGSYPSFQQNWNYANGTPFAAYPWNSCTPYGFNPMAQVMNAPGAVYPTTGTPVPAGQPTPGNYNRPMENGDMGYNLQRNAA